MRERALGRLSVLNHGHYNLEYRWKLSISEKCQQLEEKGEPLVIMDPMEGVVEPHSRLCCELAFSPPSKMTLKGCELTLEVGTLSGVIALVYALVVTLSRVQGMGWAI